MARNKNKKNPKKRTARRPISVDAGALSTQPIAWRQYFSRVVPGLPSQGTVLDTTLLAAFEHHMKFGPSRDYWSEFVFQGYVNHRHDVIWLRGIPDQPESLPHSPINDEPFLIG